MSQTILKVLFWLQFHKGQMRKMLTLRKNYNYLINDICLKVTLENSVLSSVETLSTLISPSKSEV
jgi:hypothetical protein